MSATRVCAVLVGVAMVCGLIIGATYVATASRIADNRARALDQAITAVLPNAVSKTALRRTADGLLAPADPTRAEVFAGFDADGSLVGFAIPARAAGYQDAIDLLLGYDPAQQRIIGCAVLSSRETPGLGARIADDAGFLASFGDLDVTLAGADLAHRVTLAATNAASAPWQVDGITGATISSRAVVRAVNDVAEAWFTSLREQYGTIHHAG